MSLCLRSTEELSAVAGHDNMQTELDALLAFADIR